MFLPHGEYSIELEDQLLIVNAKGPFDEEIVLEFATELETMASKMPTTWGQLNIIHKNALLTPDAEQQMSALVQRRHEMGMVAIAMLLVDTKEQLTFKNQIARIYQHHQVVHRFFVNEVDAKQWLQRTITKNH